jgi:ribose/xylose/arabinose/galactoside ABC-type transport system permease subunit
LRPLPAAFEWLGQGYVWGLPTPKVFLAVVVAACIWMVSFDNILRMCSIFGISALGMTLIIITGGIDLSVG